MDTKGSEFDIFGFLNFVLFATFVVQYPFRLWCRYTALVGIVASIS
jgi:hypothetical protein